MSLINEKNEQSTGDLRPPNLSGRPLFDQLKLGLSHTVDALNDLREQSLARTLSSRDKKRVHDLMKETNDEVFRLYEQTKQLHSHLSSSQVQSKAQLDCDRLEARYEQLNRDLMDRFLFWIPYHSVASSDEDEDDLSGKSHKSIPAEHPVMHKVSANDFVFPKMAALPVNAHSPPPPTSYRSQFHEPNRADELTTAAADSTFVSEHPKLLTRTYLAPIGQSITSGRSNYSHQPTSLSSATSAFNNITSKPNMLELNKKLENLNRKIAARQEDTTDLPLKYQHDGERAVISNQLSPARDEYEIVEFTPGLSTRVPKPRSISKEHIPHFDQYSPDILSKTDEHIRATSPTVKSTFPVTGICKTPEMPKIKMSLFTNY